MYDMTSGFQGFHRAIVAKLIAYPLLSRAHFYQTEVRYLLRHHRFAEVPIHYNAPSKSVSQKAIKNSLSTLWYYLRRRLSMRSISL
jgi:dolichol-phosphate mannosyltransferase